MMHPDIHYEIDEHPETLDNFAEIYYSTMIGMGQMIVAILARNISGKYLEHFPIALLQRRCS